MRITPEYAAAVKQVAAEIFGPDAVVRLFGSRSCDGKRGGDVDLHVTFSSRPVDWRTSSRFVIEVEDRTADDRHIDLILHEAGAPLRLIDQVALREGIVL